MKTKMLSLTDEEIVMLWESTRPETVAHVKAARARLVLAIRLAHLPAASAGLIADVLTVAHEHGRVPYSRRSIERCPLCETHAGYAVHRRSGRYHRKGDVRHDRPLTMAGHDFDPSFVRIQRHTGLGCCNPCFVALRDDLAKALVDVRAEVPEAITGHPPRFRRHDNRRCTSCGWTGHEGEMGWERTLMGNGTYPARCPQCGSRNAPLGPTIIETVPGFTVVDAIKEAA